VDALVTSASSFQRRIFTEPLVWEGLVILVSFEPDWFGLGDAGFEEAYAHLELQVLSPRGAPLPLSDTGYWSEFLAIGEAEDHGGPRELARRLLVEFANSETWRIRWARWELADPAH